MQLEQLALSLRHRNPWQAADLGFRVTQHWYVRLWLLWGLPVFVLYGICTIVLPLTWMGYITLFIWWLKPVWDSTVIVFLSRAIFGEHMTLRQTWQATPRLLGGSILTWLTWRRFSITRSADLPVSLLEHLGGRTRQKRLQILHAGWGVAGGRLTISCLHFEVFLISGLIILLMWFTDSDFRDIVPFLSSRADSGMVVHGYNLLYLLTISCIGPFYAATGFILYIMRRVELEGWDIEIRFRALASRFSAKKAVVAALLVAGLGIFTPWVAQEVHAAPAEAHTGIEAERHEASERVQKIIDDLHFTQKIPQSKRSERNPFSFFDLSFGFIASNILKITLIALIVIAILIALRKANLLHFKVPDKKKTPPVEIMFGMDVRPEAIPKNVTDRVLDYWRAGNKRTALALLYRASLSSLLTEKSVPLAAYHTEEDCIRLTRRYAPDTAEVFSRVTRMWQSLAWGHRLPDEEAVQTLCMQWEAQFGHAA